MTVLDPPLENTEGQHACECLAAFSCGTGEAERNMFSIDADFGSFEMWIRMMEGRREEKERGIYTRVLHLLVKGAHIVTWTFAFGEHSKKTCHFHQLIL
jgi:hypothetical protein